MRRNLDLLTERRVRLPRAEALAELRADIDGEPQQPWHLAVRAQRQSGCEDGASPSGVRGAADGDPP